jgi:TRAP-type mannitol/chloroaromatic compound transport system permease small subunit
MPALSALITAYRAIDRLNDLVGRGVSWLALFLVLVQFALVIMRYVFGVGSVMTQESLIYAHGVLFLMAAGYTLLHNGHVRVDIFYREASPKRKAVVDLLGTVLLLLPFCYLIWYAAFPYVMNSWRVLEGSKETSGLPGVFLLKTVILVFVVLIALQGLSLALRSILVLTGRIDPQEAEIEGGN